MRTNVYTMNLSATHTMTELLKEGWDFDTACYLMGITEEEGRIALERGE